MSGEQLFEDYDPDMEDIFGHKNTLTAKRVTITEQQKKDPLRKPKVELQGVLVAEKQPITAKDVERRMMDEYGQALDPKKYGCNTMDELLQACSDTVVHHRRRDGVHVYMAKVSEANQDIVEMVQQQVGRNENKKTPRSFLTSGRSKGFGNHGASFRSYKVTRISDDVCKAKGTPDQFKARSKLGPAKTALRLQNIADLLKDCRGEIGISHPENPDRKIVTLGSLAEKFKQVYGLPAWGKNMSESDLYKQIDVPEFAGVLSFWRLQDNGDIFVEEHQAEISDHAEEKEIISMKPPLNEAQQPDTIETTQAPPEEIYEEVAGTPSFNQSAASCPQTSVSDISFEDFSSVDNSYDSSMLITEGENDGFFESGPGFGGNGRSRQTQSVGQNGAPMTNISQRFGNSTLASSSSRQSRNPTSNGSQSGSRQGSSRSGSRKSGEGGARSTSSSVPPMRPLHSTFGSRAILSQNPLKLLADYVQSRGNTKFDALPDDDKVIVNFNSDVFKVYAEQAGEMMVRLVDPTIDTSTLAQSKNNLRDPLEADLRWMSEGSIHIKRGRRHFVKPVMFVAPRGFLLVVSNPEEEESDSDKMALMEELLRGAMAGGVKELTRKTVRPGMPAVYIYHQGAEVRYYRVLVVGRAHSDGDVMVLLADHNEQYLADVRISDLFELPEKISFRRYAPNVIFATLYGVMGMSVGEQHNMWKNLDDEERKQFIVGYIPEDEARALSIDMVWRVEGQLEWLSRIAKKRGAIASSDTNSPHLSRSPQNAVESFGSHCYIDFVDYAASQNSVQQATARIQQDDVSEPEEAVAATSEETITGRHATRSAFSPRNLDMYKLFDKFIEDDDVVSFVGAVQFVRRMTEVLGDEWQDVVAYMTELGHRNKIRL